MNDINIELIINSRNDKGFVHASLMIGKKGDELSDCGMLYLSDKEVTTLSTILHDGSIQSPEVAFIVTDKTLVGEY